MSDKQKNIETYFKEHGINNPDVKVKLLPEITDLIYERNNALVRSERKENADLKENLVKDAKETEDKIQEVIADYLKRTKKK